MPGKGQLMDELWLAALYDVLKWVAGLAAAIVLVLVLGLPRVRLRRRSLFKFLGVTKQQPAFRVYLSTVFVTPGGAVDFRGAARTFAGPAIPAGELAAVGELAHMFSDAILDELPGRLRRWLARRVSWVFQSVTPELLASPPDPGLVTPGNTLTVGSRYYNSATEVVAQSGRMTLTFDLAKAPPGIRVTSGRDSGRVFQLRAGEADDLAILEKVADERNDSTAFVAAGLGEVGSRGAADYFATNWRELYSRYGTKAFSLCLRFQNVNADPNAHRRAEELWSYAEQ